MPLPHHDASFGLIGWLPGCVHRGTSRGGGDDRVLGDDRATGDLRAVTQRRPSAAPELRGQCGRRRSFGGERMRLVARMGVAAFCLRRPR